MFASKKNNAEQNDDPMIEYFKQAISPGASEFALSMTKLLYKKDEENNVIFSPINIYAALALVLSGAEGETFKQIATLMALPLKDEKDGEVDKIHQVLGRVLEATEKTTGTTIYTPDEGKKNVKATINIRNGVFVQDGIVLNSNYVDRVQLRYKSKICNLDFSKDPSNATDIINEFISNSTQKRIPRLLDDPVDRDTCIIIASCIYFKAPWHDQFIRRQTRDEYFDTGSEKVLVKMMHVEESFGYVNLPTLHLKAVKLHYAGKDVSMVIILPTHENTLNDLVSSLRTEHLQQIEEQFTWMNIELKVPRMKFKWSSGINDYLVQLGLTHVFDSRHSQLAKIALNASPLYISNVTHAAEVEVDEDGTEANGVSVTRIKAQSGGETPIPVHVNRPFLFYIRHQKTKSILFLGTVHNPQKQTE